MPTVHPTLPADGDDAIVEPYNAAINLILLVFNGAIDADNLADGSVTLAKLATSVQSALTPTGVISAFGGSAAPTGYLLCDGSSYLRGSYPSLFAVLGTAYGSADGTHFNVPDLRGRVPVGADNMGGTAANVAQTSTTISTTNASPTATVASAANLSIGDKIVSTNVPAGTTITAISGTTITMSANATATAAAIAARFSQLGNDAQVLGATGGTRTHVLVTAQIAAHTHSGSYTTTTPGVTSGGTAIATILGGTSTGSTGGDQPHPNMQPSVVTSFIIKT